VANKFVNSVIIVDSAAGNTLIMSTISNSSTQMSKFEVTEIAFWSTSTLGRCVVSSVDTDNHIVSFGWVGSVGGAARQSTSFGKPQCLDTIKIPTLTAGTAWIYLA